MPDEKLNFSQKLAAAIERLLKNFTIHTFSFHLEAAIFLIPFHFSVKIFNQLFSFISPIQEISLSIIPHVHSPLKKITEPVVVDAGLDLSNHPVHSIAIDTIRNPSMTALNLQLAVPYHDLFKQFPDSSSMFYRSAINSVRILGFSPIIRSLGMFFKWTIHSDLVPVSGLIIRKKPVLPDFISERQQLLFWKLALKQTGKLPKQLKLIGIFPKIPLDYIENIDFDPVDKVITYQWKDKFAKVKDQTMDLAIFLDIENRKLVMVKDNHDR